MGNGWNKFTPSSAYVLDTAGLFVISHQGGTHTYSDYALDINGTAAANATNQAGNKMNMDNSTIRVANRDDQTASVAVDIAEVLFFNRYLNDAEKNHVGYYLATKYGLSTSYTEPTLYLANQSPADGAQRVGQDTQLSWDAVAADGTPTFYVYFGDDPNDVDPNAPGYTDTPVQTGPDTFYAPPSALAAATEYYWRVRVVDDANDLEGEILTFTTGGDIDFLSPSDGSTGLATDEITISWAAEEEGSTYIDGYDVYLGETLPGTPTVTVTENQWQTGELTDGTIYQCKVVSMHDGSPVGEATISFTTGALVGHWPFDDNLTDVVDANDATRDGDPHFASGFIGEGSAADFAGAFGDEPIRAPLLPAVGATASWTISFWEYSYADGGGWESIIGNGSDADGWNTFEGGRYNGNRYILGLAGNYQATANDSSFLREGWHFHEISHNRAISTTHWYIDGGLAITYTGTNMTLAPDLYVGNVKGLSQPFNGKVDDLKLYSRPLTAGQALQAYIDGVNGAPINPVPPSGTQNMPWEGLILEWSFAETPTGVSIEIGKESDLSDATPITLAADATSFDVTAGLGIKLDPSTGYFWRVTAIYPDKTAIGPTWFFVVRDLLGDVSGDLVVNTDDVGQMAGKWLDDTNVTIPAGDEYDFVDQEAWSTTGGDPNLADYDAYVAPGGSWGTSEFTVKTDPTPPDSNDFTPPSQTLLWTAWGDAGQQQLAGLVFLDSINFNDFDKFGFWSYQTGCDGNFQFRPIDEDGNQPFVKTVWGMGVNNDQWHKYEWEIGGTAGANIRKVDIWVGDNDFTIEYGNFYLVKDGVEVGVCLEENMISEDINFDCVINLGDLAVLAKDWLLDASN
jgi:hypothetical protein